MPENIRMYVVIGEYDYHRLKLWANLHGKTPSAYAGQIISARIEMNFDDIEKQLDSYAQLHGISKDEAIERLTGDKPGDIVDTDSTE